MRLANVNGAQLLLRCGAAVNQPLGATSGNNAAPTPLMLACADPRCGPALVETLLDYEADPAAEDNTGRTAME